MLSIFGCNVTETSLGRMPKLYDIGEKYGLTQERNVN
jgi:hypothetical protein